ncbi:family 1 glycosylhydrolase [Dermatophilus congolensis]|uniref:family 1 glycosylhydrolase n=1 Tax=Dermatophilus congolensis TaxID=1863 RepID=UPI00312C9F06
MTIAILLITALIAAITIWYAHHEPPNPTPTPPSNTTPGAGKLSGIAIPGSELAYVPSERLAADLDTVKNSGATWIRFDIPWTHVQWEPEDYHWDPYDRVVNEANSRGLRILAVLGTVAPHQRPPGSSWTAGLTTPDQLTGFTNYAATAATRYAGKVHAWEIWNEPNVDRSWAPHPDPAAYAPVLTKTADTLRATCPTCVIIAGGTGGAAPSSPDVPTMDWWRALATSPALTHVDGVALHPYSDMRNGASGEMEYVKPLRELLDTHGHTKLQIWGTEVGVPTGEGHVTDDEAARLMREGAHAWNELAYANKLGPLFWYTLRDRHNAGREGAFGLLTHDGNPKGTRQTFEELLTKHL